MPYFDLGVETRLFFTDDAAGNSAEAGAPLVLIHDWCCDSHDWNHQIPDFTSRHRVIAVDLRGHGRSSGSKGLRPRVLAADIAALLGQLGVTAEGGRVEGGRVVAVGHSLGAMVASALAVEHPALVAAVVAIEPAYGVTESEAAQSKQALGDLGAPGTRERLLRHLQELAGPDAPAHLTTWHRRRALGIPAHVARAALWGMWLDADQFGRRDQSTDYLGRRACPVLSVHSERQAERAGWERGVVTGPFDEVHELPGGHWLHQEHPDILNALVLGWLGRLDWLNRASPANPSSRPRPNVSFL